MLKDLLQKQHPLLGLGVIWDLVYQILLQVFVCVCVFVGCGLVSSGLCVCFGLVWYCGGGLNLICLQEKSV